MQHQSPRQRLFAALEGNPTDHVPVWLLFPYHPLGCYVDVQTLPGYRAAFEASKKYAVMLNRRHLRVPLYTEEVEREQQTCCESGWTVQRSSLRYRGRELSAETRSRGNETQIKKLLETNEDLAFYCSLPVETRADRIIAGLDKQLPKYREEQQEFPLDHGAMMLDLGEPIGPLYQSSCLESFAIWSLTHDDLVVDLLDRFQQRLRIIYEYCLKRDLADVYFLVGSELAAPPLVRHETFRRWIVPYAKELIKMIRTAGKKSIQHFHGQIKQLLPDFAEMAPDALHTIEAPPIGNCTLTEAYEILGNRITLIGNIQYDDFRALSTSAMRRAVADVLDEVRGRPFILSPTAGPFDPEVPDQVIRNYHTFMETAWEYADDKT